MIASVLAPLAGLAEAVVRAATRSPGAQEQYARNAAKRAADRAALAHQRREEGARRRLQNHARRVAALVFRWADAVDSGSTEAADRIAVRLAAIGADEGDIAAAMRVYAYMQDLAVQLRGTL